MPCLLGFGPGGTPRAAAAAQRPRYVAGSLGAARRIAAARVAGGIRFVAGIMAIMDLGDMGGAWRELKSSSLWLAS